MEQLIDDITAKLRERGEDDSVLITNETWPAGEWCAEASNPVSSVRLGEAEARYSAQSKTMLGAVAKLHVEIMAL